jgi:cob(I)alamin adenosyltransferase
MGKTAQRAASYFAQQAAKQAEKAARAAERRAERKLVAAPGTTKTTHTNKAHGGKRHPTP